MFRDGKEVTTVSVIASRPGPSAQEVPLAAAPAPWSAPIVASQEFPSSLSSAQRYRLEAARRVQHHVWEFSAQDMCGKAWIRNKVCEKGECTF